MNANSIVGTGLLSLDVVIGMDVREARLMAGGTCGNVLAIMGFLGWSSTAIGRLGVDEAADRVRTDLARWGVSLDFASLAPTAATPIIVERIRADKHGRRYHTFSWSCPKCRRRLPRYSPVTNASINQVLSDLPSAQIYFFDRPSRGALTLASAYKATGAIVFFEPSGLGSPKLFGEALRIADVVKYSHDRKHGFIEWLDDEFVPPIEIETLGSSGLRYRRAEDGGRWMVSDSFEVDTVRDTAGAGDWCTAGFLYKIMANKRALASATTEELGAALRFGQALSAWSCGFEAPRGGMYVVARGDLLGYVDRLLSLDRAPPIDAVSEADLEVSSTICIGCGESGAD